MADESQQSTKRSNHTWTAEEDKALVQCLLEVGLLWKGDNGFKNGFAVHLERMLQRKLPGCTLKATPHITSRIKLLKRHYNAICEMTGPNRGSGFGWNDKTKSIDVEKEIFNDWVKTHPNARGLYKKPFPFFDELGPIFGRDAATGQHAQAPEDVVEDLDKEPAIHLDETVDGGQDFYSLMDDTIDTQNFNPLPDTATEEVVAHSPGSTTAAKRGKKRARSEDAVTVMVAETMKDLTHTYRDATDKMDRMVSCFETPTPPTPTPPEAAPVDPRMSILDELKKIEGLSVSQRVKVAMILAKDKNMMDIFMQGDYEERFFVVATLLETAH